MICKQNFRKRFAFFDVFIGPINIYVGHIFDYRLGDKNLNIFLGPLSVNIDALSRRVL